MANLYFRGVWKVHKVLLDTVKGSYSFLTPMVKQMQEKFNKYWVEYSLILSCAAILDPCYKLNYVVYCFTTIYGIHALDFVETIISNLRLLLDEYNKKSKSTSSSLAENSNVLDKDPVDSSLYQYNVNSVDFRGAFELAFSMGKKVITPLRGSLKQKMVQVIVCLDDWLRAKGFSTEIGCKNDDDDEDDEDDVSSIAF
ncbi:hypothetical protein J1N35_034572 [Gossypium stocksii]|uniref:hAT-like transposase RNase-H fold domain-containing protein n=1 Tax=Gossypium stocksii TaxID=47602 RepID=A0A9D3USB2_9ROSI|nr:hypothetical protein J1N35_034572 [Gossypium stocksii]